MDLNIVDGLQATEIIIFIKAQIVISLASGSFLRLASESFWRDPSYLMTSLWHCFIVKNFTLVPADCFGFFFFLSHVSTSRSLQAW